MKVNNPNWYEHQNEDGFRWQAFQPTKTQVHANQDCVILQFGDENAGAGMQLYMTHESFQECLILLVKARETIEAKREMFGKESTDEQTDRHGNRPA